MEIHVCLSRTRAGPAITERDGGTLFPFFESCIVEALHLLIFVFLAPRPGLSTGAVAFGKGLLNV